MKPKPYAGSVANRSGDTAHHFSFPHGEELSLHPGPSRRTPSVYSPCRKLGNRCRVNLTLAIHTLRPFPKPGTGRIAVKVINYLGDEIMKVFPV